eukprot:TRINITY_DN32459_c0_g1_i1.p1 TRINITY_DN32459_c0_g1~~TRINITY_DN32459_c0_g1_i1.p1  ORF type:complete len:150 (+),score=5.99 TRINITY_DN32459_c0_g1_i1:41-490(+)
MVEGQSVVLFDGVCNVCNSFVNFIIDRDDKEKIIFASQQSESGSMIMKENNCEHLNLNTMILIKKGKVYTHSSAAIRTLALLGGFYVLLLLLLIIPPFIRNFGYNTFAKYRYKLFGQNAQCRLMTPEIKKRFLDFHPDYQKKRVLLYVL